MFAALYGCASAPSVPANPSVHGVIVLRFINLGDVPIHSVTVSTDDGDAFNLPAHRLAHSSSRVVWGVITPGTYRLTALNGYKAALTGLESGSGPVTVAIAKQSGTFVVEAGRTTQLDTLVVQPKPESATPDPNALYHVYIDPTPAPADALLKARPELTEPWGGKAYLGWTPGSIPAASRGNLNSARARLTAAVSPLMVGDRFLAGQQLGVVMEQRADGTVRRYSTGTLGQIDVLCDIGDNRLLAGGEEGFVGLSEDGGVTWRRLSGPAGREHVALLARGSNGKLYMVTRDWNVTHVYESDARPVQWRPIRQIESNGAPSVRKDARRLPTPIEDRAVMTRDRLVVHTQPAVLSSLDLRTGQWEVTKTPHYFVEGLVGTPDGYVVGIGAMGEARYHVYGTTDYGRTWTSVDSFHSMGLPIFVDKQRGYLLAADFSLTSSALHRRPNRMRRTEDGGKSWVTIGPDQTGWDFMQALKVSPDGKILYSVKDGRVVTSRDEGKSWR
ncbi:sialidase family protein [Caldimonas brevitalea]|nr:sialidase family protein [Caldimonas brevitalea]